MALRVPLFRSDPPDGSGGAAEPGTARKGAPKPGAKSGSGSKPKRKAAATAKPAAKPRSAPKSGVGRSRAAAQAAKPRRTLAGWWSRSGGGSAGPAKPVKGAGRAKTAKPAKSAGPAKSTKPAKSTRSTKSAKPAVGKPVRPRRKTGAPATPRRTTPPAPPAPLLQRRSVAALAARALVLAVLVVAMVAFAVALARVTLVPSPSSDALVHTNLRPGASIRAYLDQPDTRDTVKQIGGNVLLGVPFGILLPALFPRTRGLVRVVAVTALVMLVVETTQGAIVEGRAFDIDDVILNTAGALLGYLALGRRLGRALHPRRSHWYHRYGFGTAPNSALSEPDD